MNESPDLISCPNCNRPILRHAVQGHLASCGKEKPTAKVADGEKVNEKDTPNGEIAVLPPKNKKRKHDESKFFKGSYL